MTSTTLYTGGRVLLCDGATPAAEALVVRGATVLPGLVDTHPHVLHFGAFGEPLVDVADARSHEDIVARIRTRAATTPPGEWIMTTPVGEPHYFICRSRSAMRTSRTRAHTRSRPTCRSRAAGGQTATAT